MNRHLGLTPIALALLAVLQSGSAAAAETVSFDTLAAEYTPAMRPLLVRLCLDCHSTEATEGELDLERFGTLAEIRRDGKPWLKVVEMLDSGEMPPKDAQQPTPEERRLLRGWLDRYLNAEAYASGGRSGPRRAPPAVQRRVYLHDSRFDGRAAQPGQRISGG